MRLIFRSESPIDTPNLPMRLSRPIVMPAMVTTTGSLLLVPSTDSLSITPCAVTACVSRSKVPLISMPLKSTELPSWAIATGAILAVDVAWPP
ncbi:hypothetical protein D3C87_1454110 [compost metagenome]